jgi:hypothetical protein
MPLPHQRRAAPGVQEHLTGHLSWARVPSEGGDMDKYLLLCRHGRHRNGQLLVDKDTGAYPSKDVATVLREELLFGRPGILLETTLFASTPGGSPVRQDPDRSVGRWQSAVFSDGPTRGSRRLRGAHPQVHRPTVAAPAEVAAWNNP